MTETGLHSRLLLGALLIVLWTSAFHGSSIAAPAQTTASQAQKLVNADVVRLLAAGLSEEVIVTAIDQAPACDFDLSPEGLIALKKGGLSDKLITAMQRKVPGTSRGLGSGGGATSQWRRPINGFRDLIWGDKPSATMDRVGSLGRMDSYYLRGDDTRFAGVRASLITYNFWQSRLCSVKVAWLVDASRLAAIVDHLNRDWGPPEPMSQVVSGRPADCDSPEWLSKDGRTYADLTSIDYMNDRDYPGQSRPVATSHLWTLLIEERQCAREARGR